MYLSESPLSLDALLAEREYPDCGGLAIFGGAVRDHHEGRAVSRLRYIRQLLAAHPQFLAYRVQDLTTLPPRAARSLLRMPVLTWTVRSPEQRKAAIQHADQMIFEGFRP